MACVTVEDKGSPGWLDGRVAHLTAVHDHFGIDLDISDHIGCADVDTTFEETGPKEVEEWVVRKRR